MECITPTRPECPAPLVNLYPGFLGKPLATKRHATICSGCPLDLAENMLLIHGTGFALGRAMPSIKMLWPEPTRAGSHKSHKTHSGKRRVIGFLERQQGQS